MKKELPFSLKALIIIVLAIILRLTVHAQFNTLEKHSRHNVRLNENREICASEINIDRDALKTGMYFFRLVDNGELTASGKLIAE